MPISPYSYEIQDLLLTPVFRVYVFKSLEKGVYCIDKKLLTTSSLEQQDVIEQPTGLEDDRQQKTFLRADDGASSRDSPGDGVAEGGVCFG